MARYTFSIPVRVMFTVDAKTQAQALREARRALQLLQEHDAPFLPDLFYINDIEVSDPVIDAVEPGWHEVAVRPDDIQQVDD